MLYQSQSGPLKGMNPRVTIIATSTMVFALIAGVFHTERTAAVISSVRATLDPMLGWYYPLLVAFLLFFMLWLGTGRYKNVRLGHDRELPEFTFFSWITMLFAAGTGIGIIFWAVAQPILQFQSNPFSGESTAAEVATIAMRLSFFHWGLHAWAIFSFVAMVLAYFAYRHDLPLTIRSALYPFLGDRIYGPIGDAVDTLAVFGTVFGIATTLGLGVQQMNAGLGFVFGLQSSVELQLAIVGGLMLIATISVVSGVHRGVRMLSVANFWISLGVALFVLFFGPTQYLISSTIQATGDYLQNLLSMAFYTHANHNSDWQADWTIFFWGWTLAWSPFVGMFIARISRGRTLREFVMGVLLVPTLISIVWIGLLGGTALHQELFGSGGVVEAVNRDVTSALFVTIEKMELGTLGIFVSAVVNILIGTYLVTSANAGTLVVTTILAGGDPEPPTAHRIVWGIVLTLLTGALLLAGGLEILQSAVITAALPFSVVIILMILGTLRALEAEAFAPLPGVRSETPHELWIVPAEAGEEALAYAIKQPGPAQPGEGEQASTTSEDETVPAKQRAKPALEDQSIA
ncbi:BCCT family transporter [Thiohalomonas denitrificans]|uniref:BCCT family transporter n=1 Tax=Thiohalomonas denitrificans TaxID=415747 RepID=UPI0026EBF147|nr:BCCT family transporter [Thiohalomonas denitrificans]